MRIIGDFGTILLDDGREITCLSLQETDGVWSVINTDISSETEEIQDFATEQWTEEIVAAHRLILQSWCDEENG